MYVATTKFLMRIVVFFLLFFSTSFCQNSLTIKDSISLLPIQGVHLVDSQGKIYISDTDGRVFLDSTTMKSVINLSHVSYKTKTIIYNKLLYKSRIIFLQSNTLSLNEVIVNSEMNLFEYSFKDRRIINFNSGVSYPKKFQVGVFMPSKNYKDLKIKKILFELVNKNIKINDSVNFTLEIWSVDSLEKPKKKINVNEIIVKQKYSKLIEITINEEILFDKNGIYIVLDFIKNVDLFTDNLVNPKFKAVNVKRKYLTKEMLRYRKSYSDEFSEWFEPIYSKKNRQILKIELFLK